MPIINSLFKFSIDLIIVLYLSVNANLAINLDGINVVGAVGVALVALVAGVVEAGAPGVGAPVVAPGAGAVAAPPTIAPPDIIFNGVFTILYESVFLFNINAILHIILDILVNITKLS